MLTLTDVKREIGVDQSVTDHDTTLLRMIRQAAMRVRQKTDRPIAWVADKITQVGSEVHLRVVGHGLKVGETIKIVGSNCSPSLDADHAITDIPDRDTVAITETVTTSGTYATLHPKWQAEFPCQQGITMWIPQRYTPLHSITQIEQRDSMTEWSVVDSDDYEFNTNDDQAKAVAAIRVDGAWPIIRMTPRGQYGLRTKSRLDNIRITYYAGTTIVPEEIVMAGESLVCDLWELQGGGKDTQSTSFEGVGVTKMQGQERLGHVLSPESVLLSWRAR